MKPDASPSVHDDIHLQIGCRGSERRRHSYGYLVSTHRVRRAEICNQDGRRQPLRRRGCQGQFEERKTHFARVSNVPQKEERLRFVSIIAPCSSPPGRRKVCRVVGDRTASCKGLRKCLRAWKPRVGLCQASDLADRLTGLWSMAWSPHLANAARRLAWSVLSALAIVVADVCGERPRIPSTTRLKAAIASLLCSQR